MKLNDPFGRMERRHQMAYETMRDALRRGNITTLEAAQEVIVRARSRALKFAAIGLGVLFCAGLLIPKGFPIFLGIAVLLTVWTINSIVNGRRYIQRYIREELRGKEDDSASNEPAASGKTGRSGE